MRATIIKRIWIVIALAAIGFVIGFFRKTEETHAQVQASQTPRTAAQVFKNIQVIKEMPASQLQSTMQFMAASLGVDCSHCHTRPAMEKDDKPAKQTARRMLVMMNEINKNFDGKTVVNCATCHRGHTKPVAVPPLPSIASPFTSLATGANQPALPTVDQILERYVKARGGERALNRITTRKRAGVVEVAGMRGTFELYEASPNKSLLRGTMPLPLGSLHQGFDGTVGWVKNQTGVFEMRGEGLAQAKLESDFFADTRLKEQFKTISVTGRVREDNRDLYLLEGVRADGQMEKLLFDVNSGFLVRRSWETPTYFGPLPNATDFDNYKKVGDVWLPFLVRRTRGAMTFLQIISEFKLNVPMDDLLFKKPAASK